MKAKVNYRKVGLRITTLMAIAGLLFTLFAFTLMPGTKTINLRINDDSVLYLEGSSNVNTFDCHYVKKFPQHQINLYPTNNNREIRFTDTYLKIKTINLDCKNSAINKDLAKALRADEFPHISVELKEAYQIGKCFVFESCDEWVDIHAESIITIAEGCQPVDLDVQGMKLGENRYRFTASKTLLMSNFGIDPPRAMLGLVKVNDAITIHFDLTVEVLSPLN